MEQTTLLLISGIAMMWVICMVITTVDCRKIRRLEQALKSQPERCTSCNHLFDDPLTSSPNIQERHRR